MYQATARQIHELLAAVLCSSGNINGRAPFRQNRTAQLPSTEKRLSDSHDTWNTTECNGSLPQHRRAINIINITNQIANEPVKSLSWRCRILYPSLKTAMSSDYCCLSYKQIVSRLWSSQIDHHIAMVLSMPKPTMTLKYFVNPLKKPIARKPKGFEVRLTHTHVQFPSWHFCFISSPSVPFGESKIDMNATLRTCDQSILSYCLVSSVSSIVIFCQRPFIGRKHNTKRDI